MIKYGIISYDGSEPSEKAILVCHKGSEPIDVGPMFLPIVFSKDGCGGVRTNDYLWCDEYGNFDVELFKWFLRTQMSDYDFSNVFSDLYEGYETHFKNHTIINGENAKKVLERYKC